jgi:hypothetical protein
MLVFLIALWFIYMCVERGAMTHSAYGSKALYCFTVELFRCRLFSLALCIRRQGPHGSFSAIMQFL